MSCFGRILSHSLVVHHRSVELDVNLVSHFNSYLNEVSYRLFILGPDVTENFLKRNKLDYIIRSHEVKDMGYEIAHDGKCITVFSAPNYCDTMGNKGAYIILNGKEMKPLYEVYEAVPHPNVKPMMYASSLMNLIM